LQDFPSIEWSATPHEIGSREERRCARDTIPVIIHEQWHGVPAHDSYKRGLRSHPSNLIWVIPAKGASLVQADGA
jgi:hypothetical protein